MYRHNISCLTYKLYKDQLPGNFDYCKSTFRNQRVLRNNHRVDLPKFNKVSYKKSFSYRSAIIWNQLSNNCTNSPSLGEFKSKLNAEIENISFCDGAMRKRNDGFLYY